MVNPGGTGSPSTEVISARLAPLPPKRSLRDIGGLRCLWSKAKTYVTRRRLVGVLSDPFSGVEDAQGVERFFDAVRDVEHIRTQLRRKVASLERAHTMLASDGAAE